MRALLITAVILFNFRVSATNSYFKILSEQCYALSLSAIVTLIEWLCQIQQDRLEHKANTPSRWKLSTAKCSLKRFWRRKRDHYFIEALMRSMTFLPSLHHLVHVHLIFFFLRNSSEDDIEVLNDLIDDEHLARMVLQHEVVDGNGDMATILWKSHDFCHEVFNDQNKPWIFTFQPGDQRFDYKVASFWHKNCCWEEEVTNNLFSLERWRDFEARFLERSRSTVLNHPGKKHRKQWTMHAKKKLL